MLMFLFGQSPLSNDTTITTTIHIYAINFWCWTHEHVIVFWNIQIFHPYDHISHKRCRFSLASIWRALNCFRQFWDDFALVIEVQWLFYMTNRISFRIWNAWLVQDGEKNLNEEHVHFSNWFLELIWVSYLVSKWRFLFSLNDHITLSSPPPFYEWSSYGC